MSICAPALYTTDQSDAPREFRDFTEAIQAASMAYEERLRLLAEKQLLAPPPGRSFLSASE